MSAVQLSPAQKSRLLALARQAIEGALQKETSAVHKRSGIEASDIYGIFVTLRKSGQLRGCIGELGGIKGDLGAAAERTAIKAAFSDPRFPALQSEELPSLELEISLLDQPQACSFGDLDPLRFGVIVEQASRRGVLLPEIEGLNDPAEQLRIVLNKAGIAPDSEYRLFRFAAHKCEAAQ